MARQITVMLDCGDWPEDRQLTLQGAIWLAIETVYPNDNISVDVGQPAGVWFDGRQTGVHVKRITEIVQDIGQGKLAFGKHSILCAA